MKVILTLLIFVFIGAAAANGQDTTFKHTNYSLSVIMKVKDFGSVINLTPDRQIALAEFFQKEAGQLKAAMQSDSTGAQAWAVRSASRKELESVLTPAEISLYASKKKGSEYAHPVVSGGGPLKAPAKH